MLNRLKTEGWAQDMKDMLYLNDDMLEWAKADGRKSLNPKGKHLIVTVRFFKQEMRLRSLKTSL